MLWVVCFHITLCCVYVFYALHCTGLCITFIAPVGVNFVLLSIGVQGCFGLCRTDVFVFVVLACLMHAYLLPYLLAAVNKVFFVYNASLTSHDRCHVLLVGFVR